MRRDRYSELASKLRPHLGGGGTTTIIAMGGGGDPGGPHVHSFSDLDGELLEAQAPWVDYHIATALAEFKPHSIVDPVYHSVTGAQYSIIGLTATDTIGLLSSTADGATNPSTILRSGAAGELGLSKLLTPLIDTLTGDLTLDAASFIVKVAASTALQSTDYDTEVMGWRLPASGAADLVSVTANEIVARESIYGANNSLRAIHHTHDYDHVHLVINPGVSWNLDEQFGVDIDDNLLVRGYIVGKHAIQLPGSLMICHYDGAEPYETNYTGNAAGHMGQVGVESGGITYRTGKFGKAIQIAEATTNILSNPSFELNENGWAGDYGTGSTTRSGLVSLYGTYSLAMTATLANYAWYNNIGAVENGESITLSIWFLGAGSATLYLYDLTASTARASDTDTGDTVTWKRLVASWTNTTGSAKSIRFIIEVDTAGATIFFDGAQAERKAYATPYCDGSLEPAPGGVGHTWAGVAQTSASSRTAAALSYDAYTTLSPAAITAGCWVRRSNNRAGYLVSHPAISIEFL
jgi:hypothetical protein